MGHGGGVTDTLNKAINHITINSIINKPIDRKIMLLWFLGVRKAGSSEKNPHRCIVGAKNRFTESKQKKQTVFKERKFRVEVSYTGKIITS